jgi:hypothetical protein
VEVGGDAGEGGGEPVAGATCPTYHSWKVGSNVRIGEICNVCWTENVYSRSGTGLCGNHFIPGEGGHVL